MFTTLHSPVNYFLSAVELYGDTVRIRTMLDVYCPHGTYIQNLVHALILVHFRFVYIHKELAVRYQCYPMQNGLETFVIQLQPRDDMRRCEQVQRILRDFPSLFEQVN